MVFYGSTTTNTVVILAVIASSLMIHSPQNFFLFDVRFETYRSILSIAFSFRAITK